MEANRIQNYIEDVLSNMPTGWLNITTHRLDIYNEALAKTEFLSQFEKLFINNNVNASTLLDLPTAYDYIRLGHPLSCVLEWLLARLHHLEPNHVISFSSEIIPILAVLRSNLLNHKNTQILYIDELPASFDTDIFRSVYGYQFELKKIAKEEEVSPFDGSTIFLARNQAIKSTKLNPSIDFYIHLYPNMGSILFVNGKQNHSYISEIQHVRRRETIAMTPINCYAALSQYIDTSLAETAKEIDPAHKAAVIASIQEITASPTKVLVGSSGLSIQYAIMMGLIHDANKNHPEKPIKFIVPTNCYGGTNDQARRVAACLDHVEVIDLSVDGDNDMVQSLEMVLSKTAEADAIAYIIAEIPTNPRVEVPDLLKLKDTLSAHRTTSTGAKAIDPVFILDQTFCPNYHFLGEGEILSTVRTISYASGSKFPSGGLCTAGYCIGNQKTKTLMDQIELHLNLCDNEATALQYEILAKQMPSMVQRIHDAYLNTRAFVNFIQNILPTAKINFVSEELALAGFTPSVFSLDLPTKGNTDEERENYKRVLNLKLINLMITQIPGESKYCVSYGQLKGCYWTIPATSTQGTTKEGDKDYIARVAVSGQLDLERHKKVFADFVADI